MKQCMLSLSFISVYHLVGVERKTFAEFVLVKA